MPALELPKPAIQPLLFLGQPLGQDRNKFIVKRPKVIHRHRINFVDFHFAALPCCSSEKEFFGRSLTTACQFDDPSKPKMRNFLRRADTRFGFSLGYRSGKVGLLPCTSADAGAGVP
jgi:hypothetical protein